MRSIINLKFDMLVMDAALIEILDSIRNLKGEVEDLISEQKLSAKYRFHIECYFRLCEDVEEEIHEFAETKRIMSKEHLKRFSKNYIDTLLQLYGYFKMKSQFRREDIVKKESACEFLADDVFIKMKCYGYNVLVITTNQSNSVPAMRLAPFALTTTQNLKAAIILINEKTANDIKKWSFIGHEIAHMTSESRTGNIDHQEFYADFFAAMIFGATYLYSMIEHSRGSSLVTAYPNHPPWIYRIEGVTHMIKNTSKKISKEESTIYEDWSNHLISSFEEIRKNTNLNELNPQLRDKVERSDTHARRLIENYQKKNNLVVLNLSDSVINSMRTSNKESSLLQKLSPTEIIQLHCLGYSTKIFKLSNEITIKAIYQWGINQM